MITTPQTATVSDEAVQAFCESYYGWWKNEAKGIVRQNVMPNVTRALTAAYPHLALTAAPCSVEVKKLTWRKPTDHPQDMEGECSSVANGIGGRYSISNPERNKDGVYGWLLYLADDEFRWEWFPSIAEAKAAAQADFDSRILSQIAIKPADVAAARKALRFLLDVQPQIDSNKPFNGDQSKWNDYCDAIHEAERALSPAEPVDQWQDIATAPKDGTEILAWREDCDWLIVSYTSLDAFPMSQSELDELDEETLFKKDWFAQFGQERLEGSEVPTHWMPLPAAPTSKGGE